VAELLTSFAVGNKPGPKKIKKATYPKIPKKKIQSVILNRWQPPPSFILTLGAYIHELQSVEEHSANVMQGILQTLKPEIKRTDQLRSVFSTSTRFNFVLAKMRQRTRLHK
jgi:hypothetical protein